MSNARGGNARSAKYDHLIKLLLIGDSGKFKFINFIKYNINILIKFRCWKIVSFIKILR